LEVLDSVLGFLDFRLEGLGCLLDFCLGCLLDFLLRALKDCLLGSLWEFVTLEVPV